MDDAHYKDVDEVLAHFKTDLETGLTSDQVQQHMAEYGPNELPPPLKSGWLALIAKQFEDLLVLILLGSAVVSFILGLLEEHSTMFEIVIEPSVILIILILNAIVGVWQESSAEEAIDKLKEFEARTAKVLRDGRVSEIDRSEVVPGDICILAVGEKVPADCRIAEMTSRTLRTDESMLTGESVAQQKTTKRIQAFAGGRDCVDQDKNCITFGGTHIVHGKCSAIVVLTGGRTSMGKIQSGLMQEDDQKTPLGEKLDEFAELLSKVILGICVAVWLININHFADHGGWFAGAIYYFKIAVALAVAAIPEGLPAVVTTCLALGTMKMAKNKAIVRSLPSVETLGCTTVICSDKTGTLTTNQMTVQRVLTLHAPADRSDQLRLKQFTVGGISYEPRGDVCEADTGHALHFGAASKPSLRWVSMISSMCNDSSVAHSRPDKDGVTWSVTGEPTEGALKVLAEKLHVPDTEEAADIADQNDLMKNFDIVHRYWRGQYKRERTFEFTRERKSMSVFVTATGASMSSSADLRRSARLATKSGSEHGESFLLVKGAPESLLARSSHVFTNTDEGIRPMTAAHRRHIEKVYLDEFASRGLRCLGLAFRAIDLKTIRKIEDQHGEDFAKIEEDLVFVGIAGMLDPPRDEVMDAIATCNLAGMRVIVITGDNQKTAEAICRQIGLFGETEDLKGKSYTGSVFAQLSPQEKLEAVRRASLFSRVMPAHKYELVELLQSEREVVAMTGDGVNDAPALKKADIGVGMGSGTEVARFASDMVLEDDNFATIITAVREGRAIYANTKQFIRYLISSNIGEVACIFLTAALGLPEALIPVQLLWVNLVTDGLPATALGFNKPDALIMRQPPRGRTEKIIDGWMFFRYFLIGIYVGLATVLGFVWWFMYYQDGPQLSYYELTHFHKCETNCEIFKDPRPSTVSLSILVTIEMFNTFNALSENQSLLTVYPWDNIWVVLAVALSMFLHCGILYIGFFRSIFKTAALNSEEWMAVILISFPVIVLDEILKAVTRSFDDRRSATAKKED